MPLPMRAFGRGLVDAGANIVHGHGTPCMLGVEVYGGAPIIYSCGVLLSDRIDARALGPPPPPPRPADDGDAEPQVRPPEMPRPESRPDLSYVARVIVSGTDRMAWLELRPLQCRLLQVSRAKGRHQTWAAQTLQQLCRRLGTRASLARTGVRIAIDSPPPEEGAPPRRVTGARGQRRAQAEGSAAARGSARWWTPLGESDGGGSVDGRHGLPWQESTGRVYSLVGWLRAWVGGGVRIGDGGPTDKGSSAGGGRSGGDADGQRRHDHWSNGAAMGCRESEEIELACGARRGDGGWWESLPGRPPRAAAMGAVHGRECVPPSAHAGGDDGGDEWGDEEEDDEQDGAPHAGTPPRAAGSGLRRLTAPLSPSLRASPVRRTSPRLSPGVRRGGRLDSPSASSVPRSLWGWADPHSHGAGGAGGSGADSPRFDEATDHALLDGLSDDGDDDDTEARVPLSVLMASLHGSTR